MGETILVVGGGGGIGKKTAEMLIEQGKEVYIADLDVSAWESVPSFKTYSKQVNVLEPNSIEDLIQYLERKGVSLSGYVYTVGIAQTKPAQSMKPVEYEKLIYLNAIAFLNIFALLDRHDLFDRNGSSVVVISSLVASVGARGKVGYAASKGAIESSVKSMAIEYADSRIRVNAIAPGSVHTEMLDKLILTIGEDAVINISKDYSLGLGEPEDVANAIIFLLENESKWMTGNVFILDGAFSAR